MQLGGRTDRFVERLEVDELRLEQLAVEGPRSHLFPALRGALLAVEQHVERAAQRRVEVVAHQQVCDLAVPQHLEEQTLVQQAEVFDRSLGLELGDRDACVSRDCLRARRPRRSSSC